MFYSFLYFFRPPVRSNRRSYFVFFIVFFVLRVRFDNNTNNNNSHPHLTLLSFVNTWSHFYSFSLLLLYDEFEKICILDAIQAKVCVK